MLEPNNSAFWRAPCVATWITKKILKIICSKKLTTAGKSLVIKPEDSLQVCLKTQDRAESSEALGEPWLTLQVAGSQKTDQQVTLNLRWQVYGLSFWGLWGWLTMLILLALAVLFIILGFILPQRFRGALAVTFVPDRDELDEQSPQPVKQWQGVGIGFYRHARAYLHADYRLSGKAKGALAGLFAENGGNKVIPCNGTSVSIDPTIAKGESGHPLKHEISRAIPTSTCITCHMHQPNSFVNTYLSYIMRDYESDAPNMWPKKPALCERMERRER